MDLLYFLLFGAVVGFIADLLDANHNGGLITNVILGILGSFVGSWLYARAWPYLGLPANLETGFNLFNIGFSVVGALIILFIWRVFFGGK